MVYAEAKQVYHDFSTAPDLVERYIPEEARAPALRMARQVNGVTTYLSQIATGETRHVEGLYFAVGIAGMDVITDIYQQPVGEGRTLAALRGENEGGPMHGLYAANKLAHSIHFEEPVTALARWQDQSLHQFRDMSADELRQVTQAKGGNSALAHLHAIKSNISPEEEQAMYEFGYVMQLLDDHLDMRKDKDEGIATMFTEGHLTTGDLRGKVKELRRLLIEVYGHSKALDRFCKVMRWHIKLGEAERMRPGTAHRVLPWYF